MFVRQRVMAMAKRCHITVVAPVPWVPEWICRIFPHYAKYHGIEVESKDGDVTVFHPRYLTFPKIFKSLDGLFMAVAALLFFRQQGKYWDYDIVDGHWLYPDGTAALILGKIHGTAATVTVRGDDIRTFSRYLLRRQWIRWTLQNASWLFSVSEDLKKWIGRVAGEDCRADVSHNGIDTGRFYPRKRDACRKQLRLPEMSTILIAVGRIEYPKGQSILIDALKVLVDLGGDFRLVLVGPVDDDAYGDQIRQDSSDPTLARRIYLTGPVRHEDIPIWLSSADIFVMASENEGCPNVLLEAMACQLPVVTTNVGGISELIGEEEGCIFTERTPEAFAEAIAEMAGRIESSRTGNGDIHRRIRTWAEVADEVIQRMESLQTNTGRT